MSGFTRSAPLLAPIVVSSRIGLPSKSPRVLPLLARNSSAVSRLYSCASLTSERRGIESPFLKRASTVATRAPALLRSDSNRFNRPKITLLVEDRLDRLEPGGDQRWPDHLVFGA